MRTIIEIEDRQIRALDQFRKRANISRSEAIRRAVDAYIETEKVKGWDHRPAFGAWKKKARDGVTVQRELRNEWSR